jgi:hypothetical protein
MIKQQNMVKNGAFPPRIQSIYAFFLRFLRVVRERCVCVSICLLALSALATTGRKFEARHFM